MSYMERSTSERLSKYAAAPALLAVLALSGCNNTETPPEPKPKQTVDYKQKAKSFIDQETDRYRGCIAKSAEYTQDECEKSPLG